MKDKKKINPVAWAMQYHQVVIFVVCCLIAFGIYSLPEMRKNEFPDFVVRQGLVVAVAPGLTPEEMSRQVAQPLEDYIFTYKEVKKEKTFSRCRNGVVFVQVELNDDLRNKDEFWSKFKHGVNDFKTQLPKGVVAVKVLDDFGDTSALLITMESKEKTYRELSDYMDNLRKRLGRIPSVGRLTVSGEQNEQIAVTLDRERLTKYGLSDQIVAAALMRRGFVTTGGTLKDSDRSVPIYVSRSLNTVRDVRNQIIYSDPAGNVVRLKDVASVERRYPKAENYVTNNGRKCIVLSVEMKGGENIVKMGEQIDEALAEFRKAELPAEVVLTRITDQSVVVSDSINNFLKELLIAICAVIVVVMLLLPIRSALVAASTIPITIFISLGLFYAFDIELNTVTLAALIMTLGMIVDNSIVIIDNYLEQIGEGVERAKASVYSAVHFFKSILSATLAISVTFFPFLLTTRAIIHDFLLSFPWAVTLVLAVSLVVAVLLVPFLQYFFIRKPLKVRRKGFSFLDLMQKYYNCLIELCFRFPKTVLSLGIASIVVAVFLFASLPQQLLPYADRNQFAVEIYAPAGTDISRTARAADSLERVLRKDPRVLSVTSFKGGSSPRFHTAYAPQLPGSDYAQFIVNTTGVKATEELLDEYSDKWLDAIPDVSLRFKQLSYSPAVYPVEVRLSGYDADSLVADAARVEKVLKTMPQLKYVHTDFGETQPVTRVTVSPDEAGRMGITNLTVEATLAMSVGGEIPVATLWEGDYSVPVVLKTLHSDSATVSDLKGEPIPTLAGVDNVPLRQVADVVPGWQRSQFVTRGGVPTITVQAEVVRGQNAMQACAMVQDSLKGFRLSEGVGMQMGGDWEDNEEKAPQIANGLMIASVMMFFILLAHFRKLGESTIIFLSMTLCILGTCVGLLIHSCALSVTSVLGITSLMGIVVRNGIIMFDYAEELLQTGECKTHREAILNSAKRRMRPIFLTSAAASMGVVPMIIGNSSLWKPMGCVVCYGTLITMVLLLTVLPVTYSLVMGRRDKAQKENAILTEEQPAK